MDYWFSENLRRYRKAKGFTQRQLAAKIGVSQNLLCEWEKCVRYPSADKIFDLAKAMGIDADLLLKCPDSSVERTKHKKNYNIL